MTPADSRHPARRRYIDWARALAVLVMIEAHALDAWTRPADRATVAFRNATILGGFAAPLFLWLAGVSMALAADATMRRGGRRGAAARLAVRRGLIVFVLAFLFRLQALVVSPSRDLLRLFRVDILNVMGPSMAAAGLLWVFAKTPNAAALLYAAIAAAIALVTPIVRASALVDLLPVWPQWYLRPAGAHTTFTLFPWAGFVFAGAAVGVLLTTIRNEANERVLQAWIAAAGVGTIAFGFYTATLPSIYRQSSFWTSSPTWFAIRAGVLMVALSAVFALARAAARRGLELRPLDRLGRNSLFIYWIHVELVYGYATWVVHRRLPLWGTAVAYVVFSLLMYAAVVAKDRVVAAWREGRDGQGHRQTLPSSARV